MGEVHALCVAAAVFSSAALLLAILALLPQIEALTALVRGVWDRVASWLAVKIVMCGVVAAATLSLVFWPNIRQALDRSGASPAGLPAAKAEAAGVHSLPAVGAQPPDGRVTTLRRNQT